MAERTPVHLRVLDGLGEGLRGLAGPLLAPLVRGLTRHLDLLDELLAPTPNADSDAPGQAIPAVFDLDRTTHPEVHAQLAGIDPRILGPNATADEVREYVRTRGPQRRGTPEAIKAAARTALTGTRRVLLIERDGSPWRARVVTYGGETPDPAAVRRAIEAERPLGIVLTHEVRQGVTWGQVGGLNITWRQAQQRGISWDELGLMLPPEE